MRLKLGGFTLSGPVGGTILTSAPVSTRKYVPKLVSRTWSKVSVGCWVAERLFNAKILGRNGSFPGLMLCFSSLSRISRVSENCTAANTWSLCCQISHGRNTHLNGLLPHSHSDHRQLLRLLRLQRFLSPLT